MGNRKSVPALALGAVLFLFAMGVLPRPVQAGSPWAVLSASQRFTLYGADEGLVYDRVTGLLWERVPDDNERSWHSAMWHCFEQWYPMGSDGYPAVGASQGFRLPSVEELSSIRNYVRRIIPSGPAPSTYEIQPLSDFFEGVSPGGFWTSTNYPVNPAGDQDAAYAVYFGDGIGFTGHYPGLKGESDFRAWCVRGGRNVVVPGADIN